MGLGSLALGTLMNRAGAANPLDRRVPQSGGKVKNVIYLHMAGSPPQLDLFDYKPMLNKLNNKPCPKEFIEGRRLPFIKGHPKLLGSPHTFKQYGQNGQWISNMYPTLPGMADDLTFVKSMYTDQFNHAPAQMLLYTGSPRNGSASMGSWITYGLGSENANLPGFVVLISGGTDPSGGKSLWGSGYLPSVFQGVQCRSTGDPILYVSNPKGMSREVRRRSLDALKKLNEQEYRDIGDPETLSRIDQYELAYRMQISVPEVMDIGRESQSSLDLYGAQPGKASFANNCLLARRLVEQGVRYVQLFDWGWDFHGTGASNDLEHATNLARQMVTRYGMSERLGPRTFGKKEELIFLGREIGEQRDFSEAVAEEIDAEVRRLVSAAHQLAGKILKKQRAKLDEVADYLLDNETLEMEQFEALWNGEPVPPPKPPPPPAPPPTKADAGEGTQEEDADTTSKDPVPVPSGA